MADIDPVATSGGDGRVVDVAGSPAARRRRSPAGDELHLHHHRDDGAASACPECLALTNLAFARSLARRFADRGVAAEDLEQVAYEALVRAAARFDPARGVPFRGFAKPMVVGALRNHLRGSWMVSVPRAVRDGAVSLRRAVRELAPALGRDPTDDEVIALTGVAADLLARVRTADRAYRCDPLDPDAAVAAVADERFASIDDLDEVARLFGVLDDRTCTALVLHHVQGYSQAEVAEHLGLSQSQVSRLLRSGRDRLRAAIEGSPPDAA